MKEAAIGPPRWGCRDASVAARGLRKPLCAAVERVAARAIALAHVMTGRYVLVFTAFYGFHWLAYQRVIC
ncbi:MAG: hypothetical protein K2Y71_07350 [Xanthobacteraceae bacterium]|nr:hypothetical protein [Xanthobacteraceae bacterium]